MSDLKNYSIYDIAKNLVILKDTACKDGILALEQVVEDNFMPAMLKTVIKLAVDGTDSKIVFFIIDQYMDTQKLEREELVKGRIIRNGMENILNNTAPLEMLLSMATDLTYEERIQLIYLLDKSDLEHNLHGLSRYKEIPDKNEKADFRMQKVLELNSDEILQLLIMIDTESVYFALKESSVDIINNICNKTGDYVGSILTKYLWCKEPEGVFHDVNCCQDKMERVASLIKENELIQFPLLDGSEEVNVVIGEINHFQQIQKNSRYNDSIVSELKMAALYSLGTRRGFYKGFYYRLGFEVLRSNGTKMNQFKEYLNVQISDQGVRKAIEAGFELLLYQTYDITVNAMMYASMRNGDLQENIQYYKEIINKSKYHVAITQNNLKNLSKIKCQQTVNFMEEVNTSTEILRILLGQKCDDVTATVYLMGDGRARNIIEKYCEDSDIANILQNALSNPLNGVRYKAALDMLKYCSEAHSKLQVVYQMNNDELELLVDSMEEFALGIVLKMENGKLKDKILRICPSLNEKLHLMRPVVVYSSECHNSLDKMKETAEKISAR